MIPFLCLYLCLCLLSVVCRYAFSFGLASNTRRMLCLNLYSLCYHPCDFCKSVTLFPPFYPCSSPFPNCSYLSPLLNLLIPPPPSRCSLLFTFGKVGTASSRSEDEEDSDPRSVDALLSELVLILSRISLYFRFLKKHIDVRQNHMARATLYHKDPTGTQEK